MPCLVPMGLSGQGSLPASTRIERSGRATGTFTRPALSRRSTGQKHPKGMIPRMADLNNEVLDAPACPLLGLDLDPRTRYAFPHSAHRCHANQSPRGIEPGRQSAYCLSLNFTACESFQGWQGQTESKPQPESQRSAPGGQPTSRAKG